MKYFLGLLHLVMSLCLASGVYAQPKESRVALVIGNANYAQGKLANPINDARAMSARLRTLGFKVILRENLKTREIGGVYREFRSQIVPGSVALVFYAGHGIQFKGQNYFPTVDSVIDSEEDVPLQSLNLSSLLDNMEEAKAGVSLVFLDACRDNPFARRFRSPSNGLAKVETASGTLIHYATRPGSVAADGTGSNGTYTEALLAQMSEPGIAVELMLKRVTNRVVSTTKGKQEPWVEGSLRGDFYFIEPVAVEAQRVPNTPEVLTSAVPQRNDTDTGIYPNVQEPKVNLAASLSTPATSLVNVESAMWHWPASGRLIKGFDEVSNKGLDIGGNLGDSVFAVADGTVVYAGDGLRGYGNLIILKHDNVYLTAYANNRSIFVGPNQSVKSGEKIAEMGSSDADQVKLHFEVRKHGEPVDPIKYLLQR